MNKEILCEFAILGKEYRNSYTYPFHCSAFFECRYGNKPTKEKSKYCPRYQIAKNMKISTAYNNPHDTNNA